MAPFGWFSRACKTADSLSLHNRIISNPKGLKLVNTIWIEVVHDKKVVLIPESSVGPDMSMTAEIRIGSDVIFKNCKNDEDLKNLLLKLGC